MPGFSKKDILCPNCGEPATKPPFVTKEQFENGEWECADCMVRHEQVSDEPVQDRGQKEISKYDREYEFLVKLVNLVVKEGVDPGQIRDLANSMPFQTVNDIVALTEKVFELAGSPQYQIPREWLAKKLGKMASLKKADLWPGQAASEDMLSHEHNSLSYNPNQEPDTSVSGPNPKQAKQLNINDIVQMLNKGEPKVVRIDMATHVLEFADGSKLSFDDAAKKAIGKEAVFSGNEFSLTNIGDNPTVTNDPFSSPEDHGVKPQKHPFPNTNWLPADDSEDEEEPWSNVASSKKRPFSKKAAPDARYWIAPDGQEFNAGTHHGAWVNNHKDILKSYGINTKVDSLSDVYQQMYASGWSRVTNERGFTIQVPDLRSVPAYLDNFIAKHYKQGEVIRIGTDTEMVEVSNPFPNIQKAINRELRKVASLKKADISGKTVNDIVNRVHQNGGVTYNLGQGDMSGSNAFAVSIYPDRSQILDSGVDFETIEGFLVANQDLLADSSNSLGVWNHEGKTYLDVVKLVENYDEAVDLGKQHNQIAIWDLRNNNEIPTGGTGEVAKQSAEQILTQEQQNEIAAKTSPVYVMAVNNYAEALKRGHSKDRALEYAIQAVANIDKIDPKQLVEIINTYL